MEDDDDEIITNPNSPRNENGDDGDSSTFVFLPRTPEATKSPSQSCDESTMTRSPSPENPPPGHSPPGNEITRHDQERKITDTNPPPGNPPQSVDPYSREENERQARFDSFTFSFFGKEVLEKQQGQGQGQGLLSDNVDPCPREPRGLKRKITDSNSPSGNASRPNDDSDKVVIIPNSPLNEDEDANDCTSFFRATSRSLRDSPPRLPSPRPYSPIFPGHYLSYSPTSPQYLRENDDSPRPYLPILHVHYPYSYSPTSNVSETD